MNKRRWLAASIGVAAGVGILLVLRPITSAFWRETQFFGNPRLPITWAVILGIGVGAVAVAGLRFDPLVSAIPAALIFAVFLPLFADLSVPTWYPSWLRWRVLAGFSLMPFTIVGVLTFASVWPFLARRQSAQPEATTAMTGSPSN